MRYIVLWPMIKFDVFIDIKLCIVHVSFKKSSQCVANNKKL